MRLYHLKEIISRAWIKRKKAPSGMDFKNTEMLDERLVGKRG